MKVAAFLSKSSQCVKKCIMMKRRGFSYRQAQAKHPGYKIELTYLPVDATFPAHGSAPTATAPAILVWPSQAAPADGDRTQPIAVYWLREDE